MSLPLGVAIDFASAARDGLMSDDLVSIRMVIVSRSLPERDVWRKAAGLAVVPIEAAEVASMFDGSTA